MIELVERSVAEYEAMLRRWHEGGAVLYCTFLHHCWVPNASTYTGRDTMLGVQRAHRQRPDVSDILCHVYTTPDGTVWPARPPTTWNCGCQAPTRPWAELPLSLRQLINATRGSLSWERWPNAYGFSIETIGQFDRPTAEMPWSEDPTTSVAMRTSLDVLAIVHRLWNIPVEHCYFHADVSYKSCPGNRVSRAWVYDQLRRRLNMPDETRPDVSEWARPAVERVKRLGLMSGFPDGTFRGGEPLSREQAAVVVDRLLRLLAPEVD